MSILEPIAELVSIQHARHCVTGSEADEIFTLHGSHPATIKVEDRFFWVQDFKHLLLVCFRILKNFFFAELLSRHIATSGIADHARKVPNQEYHGMT